MGDYISKQTAQAVFVLKMSKEIQVPPGLTEAVEAVRRNEAAMTMELRVKGKDLYQQANNLLENESLAQKKTMVLQIAGIYPISRGDFRSTQGINFPTDGGEGTLVLKDNLIFDERTKLPFCDGIIVELRAWTRKKDLFHLRKDGTVLMLGRPATEEEIKNGLEDIEFIRQSLEATEAEARHRRSLADDSDYP